MPKVPPKLAWFNASAPGSRGGWTRAQIGASFFTMKNRARVSLILVAMLLLPRILAAQLLTSKAQWPPGVAELLERFDSTATSATTLDPAGRLALFTDDATFINAFGGRHDGKRSIDSLLTAIYGGNQFRRATIERLDRRVRVLTPDLVLVDHLERLTGQGGGNGRVNPPRMTHITLILRQIRPAVWRIVYYRAGDNRSLAEERKARLALDSLRARVRDER